MLARLFTVHDCLQPYRLKNFQRWGYHFGNIHVRWSINKSFLQINKSFLFWQFVPIMGMQIVPMINNSFLWLTNRSYAKQFVPTNSNKSFLFKQFRFFFLLLLLIYSVWRLFGANTKLFCNRLEEKCFAPLRILYLFVKSFCWYYFDFLF